MNMYWVNLEPIKANKFLSLVEQEQEAMEHKIFNDIYERLNY